MCLKQWPASQMRFSIFMVTFTKLLSFSCLLQKPLKTYCNINIFAFDRQDVFNACFRTTIVFNITHVAHAIFTFIWMWQLYKSCESTLSRQCGAHSLKSPPTLRRFARFPLGTALHWFCISRLSVVHRRPIRRHAYHTFGSDSNI